MDMARTNHAHAFESVSHVVECSASGLRRLLQELGNLSQEFWEFKEEEAAGELDRLWVEWQRMAFGRAFIGRAKCQALTGQAHCPEVHKAIPCQPLPGILIKL